MRAEVGPLRSPPIGRGVATMRAEVGPLRSRPHRLADDLRSTCDMWVIVGAAGWVEDLVDRACGVQTWVDSGGA